MPKVSVIVPVYNVEQYIRDCLNSLIQQSLRDIEVIVVDDGSTDASGEICDEYAKLDSRISVIHQQNAGVSASRNAGLDHIHSSYVMFVDGDDYVEQDFCRVAYEVGEDQKADIVVFRMNVVNATKKQVPKTELSLYLYEEQKDALAALNGLATNYVWNKMYDASLFDELRFKNGTLYEDMDIIYKLILASEKTVYIDCVLYNYRLRKGSITHSRALKSTTDAYNAAKNRYDTLLSKGFDVDETGDIGLLLRHSLVYLEFHKRDDRYSSEAWDFIRANYVQHFSAFSNLQKILVLIRCASVRLFDLCCYLVGRRKNI